MPNTTTYKTKEEYNAYHRAYRAGRGEVMREYQRKWMALYRITNKKFRQRERERSEEYKKENKEKVSAHGKVYKRISSGKLKRQPCEVCGVSPRKKKIQLHHPDYSKPLEGNWLCASDHKKLHLGTITL